MKQNGNDQKSGNYYLGLDVGTNSVGWAVTDKEYHIEKFKGNAMWGVRLFDEAQDASARRTSRTARRRLERRKQRLLLLEMLFGAELAKVDKDFLPRVHESALWEDEKNVDGKYSIFNDLSYSDKDYHKKYPTIYHLRRELLQSTAPHDVRLVFLALHHLIKSRGHFLYANSGEAEEIVSIERAIEDLKELLLNEYDLSFEICDLTKFIQELCTKCGVTAKKKQLRTLVMGLDDNTSVNIGALVDLLAGATVKFADLFSNKEEFKNAEVKSFCLSDDIEEKFDALSVILGDRIEILMLAKNVFDAARLTTILSGYSYLSEAKVDLYQQNKADLQKLKHYIRITHPGDYQTIFSTKKDKLNNYAAYSGYKTKSGAYRCSQKDFCNFLKTYIDVDHPCEDMQNICRAIKDNTFLPKLKGSENGVIPYQLQRRELIKILDNASEYLPFLSECDENGISVKEKIIKTFEFRIPYYVGPLSEKSPNNWAVRFADKSGDKIYPWNFEGIIDVEKSAESFIENLIGRCTYTGDKVLPKDSLLYSEYAMRNEINLLRVNDKPLPMAVKEKLIQELFYDSRKKVTKAGIKKYLLAEGQIEKDDILSGIDDTIKSSLKSYHDFKNILIKTHDAEMVEEIIRAILIFGEDKKMLKKWIRKNTHDLDDSDISYVCRLKYSDWGRLSRTFLTEIYSPDENGEAKTIMDYLRSSNCNLMQLLSKDYQFSENAARYRDEKFGNNQSLSAKLDSLYIAPAVRRSIRQTLRIVDEIVDIKKSVPAKIFIEVARGSKQEMQNKRTESRKSKLVDLYKACKEDSGELFARLEKEDDNSLRSDKLYLYYTQMGKCMYSGEPIDFESLSRGELYDIDHIFPRSKVKDNSLDNRVLVKNTLNREKTNIYPISADIRAKMLPVWQQMKKQRLISEKKYERLTRNYELTDKELSDFVARQLVETQQSTKALAGLLKDLYGDKVRIVYSKAGNVSDFRHEFDMIKCREVNDLHHAKDAYLNIVVGNVYDTKFTERFFANIRSENYSLNKVFQYDVKGAWDKDESIKTVKKYMAKNNILFTRMPHEVKGQLFDLQIMPAGKGQLEKKKGLSIERYGGYNKLSGAYFCLVEHTEKKKRVRTIEPVFLYKKSQFKNDPESYCRNVLNLTDPRVIVKKILIDALVELDGKRLLISGRTGNRLLLKHTYQLSIGYEWEVYIKNLKKYADRCAARKEELPISERDGISHEKNKELYELFLQKCDAAVYAAFFKNMKEDMEENCDKFAAMASLDQVRQLLEILKAFKCDAQAPDFTKLCGKGKVGQILQNNNISKLNNASIINQSVTGLYEIEADMLK